MSSGNDDDNEVGIAYTTNEEYPNHLNRSDIRSLKTTNPVEYLEFVAAQEQYAPKNLSLHQDSLLSQRGQFSQPPQNQYIRSRQASTDVHYVMSPNDNPQQTLTNDSNNNDYH